MASIGSWMNTQFLLSHLFQIYKQTIQVTHIFLSETQIDGSYPNSQFNLEGYHTYRQDRAKGGGGLMAFFSSLLASKKIKPPGGYKTLEVLAIQAKVGNNDVMFVGIYRPPKALGKDYYLKVEEELNSICMWATMERKSVIIMGDLNLDRLKPDRKEGKILIDLEEVHGLECIITEPTRVTTSSATLLDVILTNNCQLFRTSGVFNPEISDNCLIYGLMKEKCNNIVVK